MNKDFIKGYALIIFFLLSLGISLFEYPAPQPQDPPQNTYSFVPMSSVSGTAVRVVGSNTLLMTSWHALRE